MNPELILHIGLSKTGSSSIQRVLATQREAMAAQGVLYPRSPGHANHALLPASLVSNLNMLRHFHHGTWEGLEPAVRLARFRSEFAAEMAAIPATAKRLVISAEQCGGLLRDADGVRRLRDTLTPHVGGVKVVVYLRRQDQHATSAYSQLLRGGLLRPPGLPRGGPDALPEYDYTALLDRWAGVFGEAAMVPRVFERGSLLNGDVVDDFLAVCGLELDVPADDQHRQSNQSIDLAGQGMMLAMGAHLAKLAPAAKSVDGPLWRRFGQAVTDTMPGRGWRPSRTEAAAFMAPFAATNEATRRRWFPDRASLFPDSMAEWPEVAAQPDPGSLLEASCRLLANELRASQVREAQAALGAARLNQRLGDTVAVRANLVRAVRAEPDYLPARLRIGEFLLAEGDAKHAQEHLEAAQRLAPEDEGVVRLARRLKRAREGAKAA